MPKMVVFRPSDNNDIEQVLDCNLIRCDSQLFCMEANFDGKRSSFNQTD